MKTNVLKFEEKVKMTKDACAKTKAAFKELKKMGYTSAVLSKNEHDSNQVKWELFYEQTKTTKESIGDFVFTTKFKTTKIDITPIKYLHWSGDKELLLQILTKHGLEATCEGNGEKCIKLKIF